MDCRATEKVKAMPHNPHGGRWSDETVLKFPNSMPLCGSGRQYGGQTSTCSLVSCWQLNPYNPTYVQQAQKGHAPPWAARIQQLRMAGVAAMLMRSICGCGNLGLASHAWVVWHLRRLPLRTTLCTRNKPSVQWGLVGVGKRIERDSNEACLWLMSVLVCISTYKYVRVCTWSFQTEHFLKFDITKSYPFDWSCTQLHLTLWTMPECMKKPHVLFKVRTGT